MEIKASIFENVAKQGNIEFFTATSEEGKKHLAELLKSRHSLGSDGGKSPYRAGMPVTFVADGVSYARTRTTNARTGVTKTTWSLTFKVKVGNAETYAFASMFCKEVLVEVPEGEGTRTEVYTYPTNSLNYKMIEDKVAAMTDEEIAQWFKTNAEGVQWVVQRPIVKVLNSEGKSVNSTPMVVLVPKA